jgi:hypothetical protein
MNIEKHQTTVILILLIVVTGFLGYVGKMNPENVLFTIAGAVAGMAVPKRD